MDWLAFVSGMVGHLVWPGVVAGIFIGFRGPIAERIRYLKSAKAGPAGVEFFEQEAAAGVIDAAKVLDLSPANEGELTSSAPEVPDQYVVQAPPSTQTSEPTTKGTARDIVIARAIEIEDAVRDLADAVARNRTAEGTALRHSRGFRYDIVNGLVGDGIVDESLADLIVHLWRMRDEAAHDRDFDPSLSSVKNFERSADVAMRKIAAARHRVDLGPSSADRRRN